MAHTNLAHRRTHNLLLISKLLNQRDHVSPFTLVLDTLEQTAKPLIREYIRRANLSKTATIFLSFTTTVKPQNIDTFVSCHHMTPVQIAQAVVSAIAATATKRTLIFIDTLHPLCALSLDSRSNLNLTAYLSSLLAPPRSSSSPPQISMVAIYHTDIPLPGALPSQAYQPSPLSLLSYLATTILKVHSLPILLSSKQASERSQIAPQFGLVEEKEGILVGMKPTRFAKNLVLRPDQKGIVLELEHRRKSGRGVREWYFLPSNISKYASPAARDGQVFREIVLLLDDHALFRKSREDDSTMSEQELAGMTFELGLTDRQRQEREGVVLPYFDAQKEGGIGGPGEGGRILYDMGVEDDFDEEEDEI